MKGQTNIVTDTLLVLVIEFKESNKQLPMNQVKNCPTWIPGKQYQKGCLCNQNRTKKTRRKSWHCQKGNQNQRMRFSSHQRENVEVIHYDGKVFIPKPERQRLGS